MSRTHRFHSHRQGFKPAALTIAVFLLIASVQVHAVPVLWPQNGHYYEAVDVPDGINWFDADAGASSMSHLGLAGHLATVTSGDENNFITDNLNEDNKWLGGIQPPGSPEPDGGWQWVTGETWSYTNWNVGEPNNGFGDEDRLHYFDGPVWNDVFPMYSANGYVVEYDAVPEPGGLLLAIIAAGFGISACRHRGI